MLGFVGGDVGGDPLPEKKFELSKIINKYARYSHFRLDNWESHPRRYTLHFVCY